MIYYNTMNNDKELLNNNDPDYQIENFWYTYKCNLQKFYKLYPYFNRPIFEWSEKLNLYKKNIKFHEIQKNIFYFMTLHTIDTMKSMDTYYSQILLTNIKRWIDICNNIKFHIFDEDINILYNIYKIYYYIINSDVYEYSKNLFKQSELLIFFLDYTPIISFAVKYNKGNILDKLNNIIDISQLVEKIYSINIYKNTKGSNIIKKKKKKLQLYNS